ncbi:hypothetical protein DUNSADRAFT_2597 [Dunaliella salina]|uniref:Uncharacterized protein n=1 Tax=Dunaliella salina TaxID=3046 RepID=A0ABQ7GV86_DUNSA|nr:hypothetical protein DUNSADRAFT_2597 [Dunaliella salina]|eukprot:KAF5838536.1 hypothetical protein DUNSADRAFT_2597 [Dunaliella salina]
MLTTSTLDLFAALQVSGGVEQHTKYCEEGLNNALQELEELKKVADGGDEAAKKYADLKARMPDIAAGYAACAEDGLAGVTALTPLVSLVLLPEKVDREIEDAQQIATRLRKQVEQQGLAKRGAVAQGATSGGGSSERNLSMKLKVLLQLQLRPKLGHEAEGSTAAAGVWWRWVRVGEHVVWQQLREELKHEAEVAAAGVWCECECARKYEVWQQLREEFEHEAEVAAAAAGVWCGCECARA